MFRKPKPSSKLELAIDALLDRIATEEYDFEETPKIVDQVTKLIKLKETSTPKRPSPDTWILVAGNLIGIVIIIGHERANVITSKALGFVMRLK
jgi:hypothetical protein